MKMRTGIMLAAMVAAPMTTAFAQSGADTYKAKCQMCHAADGTGNAAMKVPSFKAPASVKASDADLIAAVTNGKGTGTIKMPAYTSKLTAAQIKDVVGYVRTLQK
ncbi:MAG: c-type cytochrome [Acidobacteriaceae bacterium]